MKMVESVFSSEKNSDTAYAKARICWLSFSKLTKGKPNKPKLVRTHAEPPVKSLRAAFIAADSENQSIIIW